MRASRVRIGLSQMPNTTSVALNAQRVLQNIDTLASLGVDMVIYPECMLTGFSAAPQACDEHTLRPHLDRIHALASQRGMGVLLPSVLQDEAGAYFNAGWMMSPMGARYLFMKTGLTHSELRFFSLPAYGLGRVFVHNGVRVGVVMCREVAEPADAYFSRDDVDVVAWPAYWRWGDEMEWGGRESGELGLAAHARAGEWERPLLQVNFSENDAQDTRDAGPNGRSVVVDAHNVMRHQAMATMPTALVVELERRGARWEVVEVREYLLAL